MPPSPYNRGEKESIMELDIIERLTRHIEETEFEALPEEVRKFTKFFIMDIIACGMAGSSAPGIQEIVNQFNAWGGKPESTVIAYDLKLPSIHAAFANSTSAHALDYDDTHNSAGSHTTSPVIPPALAIAEAVGGISGKNFITAVAVGVDIGARIALALKGHMHSGWLPASVSGGFGAVAALSGILRLNTKRIRNAFGIAYSQASGNRQALLDGAITKRMQPAFSGMQGIYAAHFAKQDITGAQNIFSGKYALPVLYSGGQIHYDRLTKDLGMKFEITNLACKLFPCCSSTHPSIEATLRLVKREKFELSDIDCVEITIPPGNYDLVGSPFQIRQNPQVDAQFSNAYTVATAIINKKISIGDFQESVVINNTQVHELAKKIKSFPDESGKWVGPNSYKSIVRIKCADGREFMEKVRVVKGYPEDPVTTEDVLCKFNDCVLFARKEFPKETIDQLIDTVLHLEQVDDMRQVCNLFT